MHTLVVCAAGLSTAGAYWQGVLHAGLSADVYATVLKSCAGRHPPKQRGARRVEFLGGLYIGEGSRLGVKVFKRDSRAQEACRFR